LIAEQPIQQRFDFGRNWLSFLESLTAERIAQAEDSLRDMLGSDAVKGKSFLDVGSGSGLFSLAAMRLGASKVHSFDYDQQSVECAKELKRRFFPESLVWTIEKGDALDEDYVQALGTFDIVYSWGVLHHTGNMWRALDLVSHTVSRSGVLFIALYDDAGVFSRLWLPIKKYFNKIPSFLRLPYLLVFLPIIEGPPLIRNIMNFRSPFSHWRDYFRKRGMSRWHDIEDWVGGYPYEFTKCDKVFEFYRSRGFRLDRLTCAGLGGNNQFLFTREPI
jgi:2-polyprenyl-3-methyl-5-hydroxy-6-metoxy-1,4-benzoquinol methylase